MSISNRHTVNQFVSGKSEPMSGQRLSKVGYKTTAKQTAKFPSVCASIPFIQTQDINHNLDALIPHIRSMLENAQDGIFRSLYESSDGTLTAVSDDDLSVQACIAFLNAENQGSRLTKEFLEQWFDSQMRDNLFVVIADKLGFSDITTDVEVTVNKHLAGYKGLISSLAGGKTILQPNQITSLTKALELCSIEDDTSSKLRVRLIAMSAKPKIEELLEL